MSEFFNESYRVIAQPDGIFPPAVGIVMKKNKTLTIKFFSLFAIRKIHH